MGERGDNYVCPRLASSARRFPLAVNRMAFNHKGFGMKAIAARPTKPPVSAAVSAGHEDLGGSAVRQANRGPIARIIPMATWIGR